MECNKIKPPYLGLHIDSQISAGGESTSLFGHVPRAAEVQPGQLETGLWPVQGDTIGYYMVTEKPIDFLYCFTACKLVFGYCLIRAIVLEGGTADTEAVLECREMTKRKGSIVKSDI